MAKTITITISPLVATCLQRMIYEEIENQKKWNEENIKQGNHSLFDTRLQIIDDMRELSNDLQYKGFHKYYKCN